MSARPELVPPTNLVRPGLSSRWRLCCIIAVLTFFLFETTAGRLLGQSYPTLVSARPTSGSIGFPTHGVVEFTFSEAMQPKQKLFWLVASASPITRLVDMDIEWSYDLRTLRAWRRAGFPPGEKIDCVIDEQGFASVSGGLPLDLDRDGSFTLRSEEPVQGAPYFLLSFLKKCPQSGTNLPALDGPVLVKALARLGLQSRISEVQIVNPKLQRTRLYADSPDQTSFSMNSSVEVPSQLPTLFPTGDYRFEVDSPDYMQFLFVPVTSVLLPDPAQLTELPTSLGKGTNNGFRISWTTGFGVGDAAVIRITDGHSGEQVYSSPEPGSPNHVTIAAGSVDLAPGVLKLGRDYRIALERWQNDSNSAAGFTTSIQRGASTESIFTTLPYLPLRITQLHRTGTDLILEASGFISTLPTLEKSSDLRTWSRVGRTFQTNSVFWLEDDNATNPAAFYRLGIQ